MKKIAGIFKSMLFAPLKRVCKCIGGSARRMFCAAGINTLIFGGLTAFAIGMAMAMVPGFFGVVINELFLGFVPGLGTVLAFCGGIMFCRGSMKKVNVESERRNQEFRQKYEVEQANRIAVEQQIRDLEGVNSRLQDKLKRAEIRVMANIDGLENGKEMVLAKSNETVVSIMHEKGEERPRSLLSRLGGRNVRESSFVCISQQVEKKYGMDLERLKFSVDGRSMKIKVYGAEPKLTGVLRGENPEEETCFTYTEYVGSVKGAINFDKNRMQESIAKCKREHQKRTEQINPAMSKCVMDNFKEWLAHLFGPFGFTVEIVSGAFEDGGLLSWKEVFKTIKDVVHKNYVVEDACCPEEAECERRYAGGFWLRRNPSRSESRRRSWLHLAG